MILHIALAGLHLRRPSLARIKTAGRVVVYAAAVPVVLLAERVGLLWPALLVIAVGAGAHVGRLRGASVERTRHIAVMEGLQEVNHEQRALLAGLRDEQRHWWNADIQDRRDRHINSSRTRPGVGQPTKGIQ